MEIEKTIWNFNITVLEGDSRDAKVQIETLPPMTKDEFWDWLLKASKRGELPRTSRPSRETWRDTKESPQPKSALEKMGEFARQYKKFKRQFPQASHEFLSEKTNEFLRNKDKILEDFKANFAKNFLNM